MKTVFFDIDTQLDFLYPAGALYVPGAEKLAGALAELTQHAAAKNIPVVSTMDAHSEDDPEFKIWPPHCVAGTTGQQKAGATLLPRRYVLTGAADALDRDAALSAQQVIVEKQHVDPFMNPNLPLLLDLLQAERYVVYGVATEVCVANAVQGLLGIGSSSRSGERHASRTYPVRVEIVEDAVKEFSGSAGCKSLAGLVSAGVVLTSTRTILEKM
jgi:nicotinamidase/pyrazinamidase